MPSHTRAFSIQTQHVSNTAKDSSRWSTEHESLLEHASRLEEARTVNRALAMARAILHEGDHRVAQTRKDFEAEKQRAAAAGIPVHPKFRSWMEWEDSARAFHEALRAMYPPETDRLINALAVGEAASVGWAIVFLEADPRCFRAGYLRERMLRYLARMIDQLDTDEKRRLRKVTLLAVDDPWRPTPHDPVEAGRRMGPRGQAFHAKFGAQMAEFQRRRLPVAQRREFKWYCRLAAKLDGDDLNHELEARARADDAVVARRASLMLGAIARKQKPTPQA